MIDDLCNIEFQGESSKFDWGARCANKDSLWAFLNSSILNDFPYVKFVFYVVAGVRTSLVDGCEYSNKRCIDGEFPHFLRKLERAGHEIAYHGTNHGEKKSDKFIQEWDLFLTLNDAISTTADGKSMLESVGVNLYGGKYCGYKSGSFGHDSIVANGFLYWFSQWSENADECHLTQRSNMTYFPSNIDPSQYSFKNLFSGGIKKGGSSVLKNIRTGNVLSKIDTIINKRGIISLQEHSSPIRSDGQIQFPNVWNDLSQIIDILKHLAVKKIWYATPIEIYRHKSFIARTNIDWLDDKRFIFSSDACEPLPSKIYISCPDGIATIKAKTSGERFTKGYEDDFIEINGCENEVYIING